VAPNWQLNFNINEAAAAGAKLAPCAAPLLLLALDDVRRDH